MEIVAPRAKRIALIHALPQSVEPINDAMVRLWPEAMRANLLDDSLATDLAAAEAQAIGSGLDALMHERFARLTQYAVDCGADAVLFTCSAFGPCIEAAAAAQKVPVLKPNEGLIEKAAEFVGERSPMNGQKLGLVASFAPTLTTMPDEFPTDINLDTELAPGAMQALQGGDSPLHDQLIVEAAKRLVNRGAKVIALAQYSMAHCRAKVEWACGVPVLITTDTSVAKLKRLLT